MVEEAEIFCHAACSWSLENTRSKDCPGAIDCAAAQQPAHDTVANLKHFKCTRECINDPAELFRVQYHPMHFRSMRCGASQKSQQVQDSSIELCNISFRA